MRASSSTNSEENQPRPSAGASEFNDNGGVLRHHRDGDNNGNQHEHEDKDNSRSNDNPSQIPLPIEYQLDEVNLNDPDMDPLEYTFRKYFPIPRAYFWDTASEANQQNQNLPLRVKLWHNAIYYLGRCLRAAEAGGEVVANILGVNSGPFDYVTENMTEQEMERSREILESRREKQAESERRKEGFV